MQRTESTYTPDRCPLCGETNACAMELEKATGVVQGSCWCVNMGFTPELLAQVPVDAQSKACICAACAQAATQVVQPLRVKALS